MDPQTIAGQLLPLLFNMMGPIGLMPVFAGLTAGMDAPTRGRVALRAAVLAAVGVLIAATIGTVILNSWGISRHSLIVAAGVLLALSALRTILLPPTPPANTASAPDPKATAVRPLAFPTIVTPHGIGVVIIFIAFLDSTAATATVLAVAGFIILLDYGAMRVAHRFMASIGMTPLLVLGAVFGVLQVALGVEMVLNGLAFATAP